MTSGQAVIFAVGLAFVVFILAGDFGFKKLASIRRNVTK